MKKKFLSASLGFLAAVLAPLTGWAQPANDNFASRTVIPSAGTNSVSSNLGAGTEAGEATSDICGRNIGATVWWRWVAPAAGTARVSTQGSVRQDGQNFDTVLQVLTGTAVNALTQVACNDEGGGNNTSLLTFNTVQGTEYQIRVGGRRFNFGGGFTNIGTIRLAVALPPTITITAPAAGATLPAGGSFTFSAMATSQVGGVARVDFYAGTNLLANDTTSPYSITASALPLGTNVLTAVVVDSVGQTVGTSVTVLVLATGVTILSPADGAVFGNTNAITINAGASVPSGSITNVRFLVDGLSVGEDASAPFSVTWTQVTPGVHRITGIGTDTSVNSYTSAPVLIAVAQTLVASNSVWKYNDTGTDLGTAWQAPGYDDGGWTNGPAELGYGDGDEATVVSFGPDTNNRHPTTYFRRAFEVTNAASFTNLFLFVERDDGAVVHLNGREIFRTPNFPAGPVLYSTFTTDAFGVEDTLDIVSINPTNLVQGNNVFAVEIHQNNGTSSDISFNLQLVGMPIIVRNQPPLVALTSPAAGANFQGPSGILLTASASDPDMSGSVTKVEFFADGVKLGEDTTAPYEYTWDSPPLGLHTLHVVATDNENATTASAAAGITVYDALGTPWVAITSPTNGAVFDGPTNLAIAVQAAALDGIDSVELYANGVGLGVDYAPPFTFVWTNATFATNTLTALVWDTAFNLGESAPVTIIVNPPPPNLAAPSIAAVAPARNGTVSNLTSMQITFSERVINVNAADLLIQGVAAASVAGSGSNYTFSFAQPAVGTISITWAGGHGIEDVGYPPLPFDTGEPGATWTYNLIDLTPPVIATRAPAANATVTNLSQVSVTFSEPVLGVTAGDLLVNGTPALSVTGGGAAYTFGVNPPAAGSVTFSWAAGHGITDQASPPNAFDGSGPGAIWSVTLDNRTLLVQSNATWLFIKGTAEASTPIGSWRTNGFNDGSWSNALAPFYYGDPYNSAADPGTLLSDMLGGYSSVYLRRKFVLDQAAAVTNIFFNAQSDDGFIAWINGVEVIRYNMPGGDIAFNGEAPSAVNEPNNRGAAYLLYTLTNTASLLLDGTNTVAVHAFNNQPGSSSDFGFNAQLYTYLADNSAVPPRIASITPAPGEVFALSNVTIRFSEPVGGADSDTLLINGVPASDRTYVTNTTFIFHFAQPAYGPVTIRFDSQSSITDLDMPPKPFDPNAPGAIFQYNLLNPSAPTVAAQTPAAGATVNALTSVAVTFSEPVTGVHATDLRINGSAAAGLTGSGAGPYTFTFPQPAYGPVAIAWITNHGITDLDVPAVPFDSTRAGASWSYTLVDLTPPTIVTRSPAAGSLVTNLTSLSVTFSEAVTGVNAADLRVNGSPATGLSGGGAGPYTFTFAQPNATIITVTWAPGHGIRDLAAAPNGFEATAPGATWSYTTPDNVPPTVALLDPPPYVTLRQLTQIRVTFNEPVTGVDTNDLLMNNVKARSLTGSGAGPYTFTFLPPALGIVDVKWSATHGITDLALPAPNSFPGGEWTYTYDPAATFAGKILINEIMFDPPGGVKSNEWVELRNVTTNLINLAGWRFTRGIGYTFPNVSIPAGGYLVLAADLASFQARYPTVTNALGGWTGSLANSDETVELETSLGETVNSVHYASDGDWGQRVRGNGSERVESITRNGSTATITIFQHTYSANDQVVISGANEAEYNGRFTVSGVTPTTFNITVSGTPDSPGTGDIICRWVQDDGSAGWSWFSGAGGFGSSLELANAAMPNSSGQNWLASAASGGTPGRVNSVATTNIAPLIADVTHFPPVPNSSDNVTITARVRDESSNGVAGVTIFYRNHTAAGPGAFLSANMLDNGANGDGLAGDGLYGAVLPPNANGTVIEFYVQAADTGARTRTWPAPALDTTGPGGVFGTPGQFANALYQVDNEVITNAMGSLRLVMTGTERAAWPPGNNSSDASPNCSVVTVDGDGVKIRYLCSVRVRGAGSRSRNPKNNRIEFPNDNRWNGASGVNLNSMYPHAQLLGNNLALKSGVPTETARVIQYRVNGVNLAPLTAPVVGNGNNGAGYGAFVLLAPPNGDLAEMIYPLDGDGNFYRASTGGHNADLSYQSGNPVNYLNRGYYKTSNKSENDWTGFARMTFAFEQVGPDADYVQAISTNVNVGAWMRYFALGSLINFGETALFNGRGDDYALYHGLNDRRFVVLGHDFDTCFGQGDNSPANYYPLLTNSSIFLNFNLGSLHNPNANVPLLRRFMTNAAFAPIYYAEIMKMIHTTFHPTNLNPLIDQLLGNWNGPGPDANTIATMKQYAANRRSVILSQIPLALTVSHALPTQSGYLYTTTPAVALTGASHAIDTRKVLVNGVPASWFASGATWSANPVLHPGVNRVVIRSLDSNDVEFARATLDVWYDDASVTSVSGALATDTVWSPANGPYQVTATVTVNPGVTLTIQPGTAVHFAGGAGLTVANGGRLLAEGTDAARIRFTRVPGGANWTGVTINGGAGSPETRIAHAHFEFNNSTAIDVNAGGELFLSHCSFGNTAVRYLDLDGASFVVQDCHFPAATAAFEPIHGSSGIKAGGRGVFQRCFVGKAIGYNDSIDFTGGNRPGPILQVLNCVFMGSDDDLLDLDSTDAWIEGNIFLHVHRNGSPDSASAVSGGADNADTSQITVIGNLFYNVDQAANAKQGNFYTFLNNTIANQNRVGSQDAESGVITMADHGTPVGLGLYLEGNIISGAEQLVRTQGTAQVTFTNNIHHQVGGAAWSGPGGNNSTNDPLFVRVPLLAETTGFANWSEAQVMWDWFSLRPGSPARGSGPAGLDKGALVPSGAALSGVPVGTTPFNSATIRISPNRTGSGIPAGGFPNGSGFTHYRWRLDGGMWSAETPAATPITLSNLANGQHYVEVTGKNDAGFYQDDPIFGADGSVTLSRTWTVNTATSPLRLSEVLAANTGTSNHFGTTPDLVELWNSSAGPLDIGGVGVTDDPANPFKFIFPLNTTLAAGAYLTVLADSAANPGTHLGFSLPQSGGALYLYDSTANGGALIDSISFGLQLPNLSVGRLADGAWTLCSPTFSGANREAQAGDPRALKINEWLAIAVTPIDEDFIELLNGDARPVALGGLYISDEPFGWPARHPFAPLSFIGGGAYLALVADGDTSAGADHLGFTLNGDQGSIGLFLSDLTPIDCVTYQAQSANVAQGRSANGSQTVAFLTTPTPGAPNPLVTGPPPFGGLLVVNEILAINNSLAELDGRRPDWIELYNGTATNVNLGDFSVTDNSLAPRKFVFAPNTIIPSGGHLRVICGPNSTNPTPLTAAFGIAGSGGAVYLFDAPGSGGALLDSLAYGLQADNLSIARVPSGGGAWSLASPTPGTANIAIPTLGDAAQLRLNEWMASPGPNNDDWFELLNPTGLPVALGGFHFTDDLNDRTKHAIPALSFIGSGTNGYVQFRADGNVGAGADHVSFSLNGALGESIGFSTPAGALIDGVTFGPQTVNVSAGRFPDGSTNVVSFPETDSPGAPNYRRLATVAISEVLTHTDLPLEDAIELVNLTDAPIDISGWWLSDDPGALQKYQIPFPTMLPANGYAVIYETHFTNANEAAIPFALSSHGDEVVLSAASGGSLTGFRAERGFGAADNAVSFGLHRTSDGREEFVATSARTFGADDPGSVEDFRLGTGAANAYPRVGPVVISEIMYHPPDIGTNDNAVDEFIELQNITTVPVSLYDPAAPTNTWRLRDAVDYDFPSGTTLPPGGQLLVVGFDPVNNPAQLAAFRATYAVDPATPVLGPWSGRLSNGDDDIELRKPGVPDEEGVDSILVERVHYYDLAPWPALADGTGLSLQRAVLSGFGNDPTNWFAATPTAGPQTGGADTDGDGMPDSWELANGFDTMNAADAALDYDGDGLTNLQEYQLGTDPRDAASGLRLYITLASPNAILSFNAPSNFTFAIDYTDALGTPWQLLQQFSAAPTNRLISIGVPATNPARFYRLRAQSAAGLLINAIEPLPGNQARLTFSAPAGLDCTVVFKASLNLPSWTALTNFPAAPTNRTLQVVLPAPSGSGIFRLRTP